MPKKKYQSARGWRFKALSRLISLSLLATVIIPVQLAEAVAPVISTKSTIANGAESPPVFLDGVGFDPNNDKFDFTVDMGTTGLEYDSVAFDTESSMRFNFHGRANAGTITIQANVSAFSPVATESSNTVSIIVPLPLITQIISFTTPTTMTVKDKDQVPIASSSSGLTVVLTSNTPSTCTIDFLKIHAVAAGICSITATSNGNTTYSQGVPVTRSFTVLSLPSVETGKPQAPADEVTYLGSASYDPKHTHLDYVSVLVASKDADSNTKTLVKLLLPPGVTDVPAVLLISAFSSDVESSAQYFVARIKIVSGDGSAIAKLKKAIEINIPAGAPGSIPSWSLDGQVWYKLKEIKTEVLPADYHAGYFVESDGRIAIFTDYLMLFGHRKLQEQLRISTSTLLTRVGVPAQFSSSGGSGTAEVRFYTRTAEVCTVTPDGVMTGLTEGKCLIAATRGSSGFYSNAISSAIPVFIQGSSTVIQGNVNDLNHVALCQELSYTFLKTSTLVFVNLCEDDAGETAYLEVGTKSKSGAWSYTSLLKQKLDGNGSTLFKLGIALQNGQVIRVRAEGKIQVSKTVTRS